MSLVSWLICFANPVVMILAPCSVLMLLCPNYRAPWWAGKAMGKGTGEKMTLRNCMQWIIGLSECPKMEHTSLLLCLLLLCLLDCSRWR